MPIRSTELDSVYFYNGTLISLGPNLLVSSFSGPGTGTLTFNDVDNDYTYENTESATFEGETVQTTASGSVAVGVNIGGIVVLTASSQVDVDVMQTASGCYLHYPNGDPASLFDELVSDILAVPGIEAILLGLGITDIVAYVEDNALLTFTLDADIAIPVCFGAGTLILTKMGLRKVEGLELGEQVLTRDSGFQSVRWVGKVDVSAEGNFAPIEFQPGSIGNDTVLRLSPEHRVLVTGWAPELLTGQNEVFVAAKHLVNGSTIKRVVGGRITYVHFMFERHEIVVANGANCESFHPGEVAVKAVEFRARQELYSLFPELRVQKSRSKRCLARSDMQRHVALAIGKLFARDEECPVMH